MSLENKFLRETQKKQMENARQFEAIIEKKIKENRNLKSDKENLESQVLEIKKNWEQARG